MQTRCREGKDEALALSGFFMAAGISTPANENPVLTMLCLHSVTRAMQNLSTTRGT